MTNQDGISVSAQPYPVNDSTGTDGTSSALTVEDILGGLFQDGVFLSSGPGEALSLSLQNPFSW